MFQPTSDSDMFLTVYIFGVHGQTLYKMKSSESSIDVHPTETWSVQRFISDAGIETEFPVCIYRQCFSLYITGWSLHPTNMFIYGTTIQG
jgi:hypothetical protein